MFVQRRSVRVPLLVALLGFGSAFWLAGCSEPPTSAVEDQPDVATEAPEETFTRSNWDVLATDPDAHKGAPVRVAGKVFMPPERGDEAVVWQMHLDPEGSDLNCVVRYDDPNFDISDGDYVHVEGVVEKELKGQNLMGGQISAPVVRARKVEQTDVFATLPTAETTIHVHQAQTQHGVTVAIDKVDIAPRETRVHVEIDNESKSSFEFHSFMTKLVQGSTQFDTEFRMDYPEPQTELLPGISTSGVIPFKKIDGSQEFRVILEGMSDDWQLEFEPFEFTVSPEQQGASAGTGAGDEVNDP